MAFKLCHSNEGQLTKKYTIDANVLLILFWDRTTVIESKESCSKNHIHNKITKETFLFLSS